MKFEIFYYCLGVKVITEASPVSVPVVLQCCSYSTSVHPAQTTYLNSK